jgi:hypothetical protein
VLLVIYERQRHLLLCCDMKEISLWSYPRKWTEVQGGNVAQLKYNILGLGEGSKISSDSLRVCRTHSVTAVLISVSLWG